MGAVASQPSSCSRRLRPFHLTPLTSVGKGDPSPPGNRKHALCLHLCVLPLLTLLLAPWASCPPVPFPSLCCHPPALPLPPGARHLGPPPQEKRGQVGSPRQAPGEARLQPHRGGAEAPGTQVRPCSVPGVTSCPSKQGPAPGQLAACRLSPLHPAAGGRRRTAWTCWRLSPPTSPDAGCAVRRRPSGALAAGTSGTARGKAARSPLLTPLCALRGERGTEALAEGMLASAVLLPRGRRVPAALRVGGGTARLPGTGCIPARFGRAGAALSRGSPSQGVPGPALAEAPHGLRPAGTGAGDSGCPVSGAGPGLQPAAQPPGRRSPSVPPGRADSSTNPPAALRAPGSLSLPLPTANHPPSFCTPTGLGTPSFLLAECNKPLPPLPCTQGQVRVLFFYSVQHQKSWKTRKRADSGVVTKKVKPPPQAGRGPVPAVSGAKRPPGHLVSLEQQGQEAEDVVSTRT